jgi:HD-GYP domain-containing protein (c-di-GMP phosphodiesterase class II)
VYKEFNVKSYAIDSIKPDMFFSKSVYLDKQFILLTPEMQVPMDMIKALTDWGFKEVLSEGESRTEYIPENVNTTEGLSTNNSSKIKEAEAFYLSFQTYVEELFTLAAINNEIDFNLVVKKVQEVLDVIRENRLFLLRILTNFEQTDQNYLASHAVKSTIIAIIIGTYLKLPVHRLIELGTATVVHEIGMIKLPPQVYLSKRALLPQEKKAILTHPILGYNFLKASNFPLTISLAVLEHHERENGSGYPQRLTSDKISFYAKIIAVACSYDALTTDRPHKEGKDGFAGMLDLLKNEGKRYDDTIVRALVFSLSIYPIGLYVLLSNNRKGQVIDVNPDNPRLPIVQIFGELTPDGKNVTVETSPTGISIIRPLTREEVV